MKQNNLVQISNQENVLLNNADTVQCVICNFTHLSYVQDIVFGVIQMSFETSKHERKLHTFRSRKSGLT